MISQDEDGESFRLNIESNQPEFKSLGGIKGAERKKIKSILRKKANSISLRRKSEKREEQPTERGRDH